MSGRFSAESMLIHAGTARVPAQPATPPLVPASIYVSEGEPRRDRGYGRDGNPGWEALEEKLDRFLKALDNQRGRAGAPGGITETA